MTSAIASVEPGPPPDEALDPDAIGGEIISIEQTMREDPRAYVRDEPLQARYRALIDAREGVAAAPAPVSADAHRRAALQRLMRDPRSAYWRGPEAERLQAEFRALVAADDPATTATRLAPDAVRAALPAEIVAEWDADGFTAPLTRAQDAAATILAGLGDRDAAPALMASFGALPECIRVALYRELAAPPPRDAATASPAQLKALAVSDFGTALASAWRDAAPRRLGGLIARFARIEQDLKASHIVAFKSWWGDRSAREKIAVLCALGDPQHG
jgi:hypothetical protein